jgi:DNA polymerase III gamma/tau subunit
MESNFHFILAIGNSSSFNVYLNDLVSSLKKDYSLVINEVNAEIKETSKLMLEKINQSLTSYKREEKELSLLVIKNFDALSPLIQNALLKSLEEPSPSLKIIAQSKNVTGVLPTILSRAKVEHLKDNFEADVSNVAVDNKLFTNEEIIKIFEDVLTFKVFKDSKAYKHLEKFLNTLIENKYCHIYEIQNLFKHFERNEIKLFIKMLEAKDFINFNNYLELIEDNDLQVNENLIANSIYESIRQKQ